MMIEPHRGQQHGHADRDQPGQLQVLPHGHDHAADAEHGRGDHERGGHQDQLLDLLDVVGGAGDEAGRAEPGDFLLGELGHPGEDGAPRTSRPSAIAAFAPKYTAAMVQAICSRVTMQHHGADAQDVVRVPLRHALVDDVRVQGGQVQRGDGRRQLEDDDGEQQPPLRPQVFDEQFPEHPVSTSRVTAHVM